MAKMHKDEFDIDEHIVRKLLKDQCPKWAGLSLQSIPSSGTDNSLFRLGTEWVVRLPRIQSATNSIEKEYEWVPRISEFLKIPVSVPLFKGKPSEVYPWAWIVAKWNEGQNPPFETENEYQELAKDLSFFLNELHEIHIAGGPPSRRGVPLRLLEAETRKALAELAGEINVGALTSLWDQLSAIPQWSEMPVWIHGDFLPGNVLIKHNRLSAVIDFSDLGIGDPACDLVIAWSLLNSTSRRTFKLNLRGIDDATWERGRGWALSIALIMLPYYKTSNPYLTSLARRMIDNVTAGSE